MIGVSRNNAAMNLRQARLKQKWTLKQLAARVDSDATNISRIERGIQRPSTELGRRLYFAFGGQVDLGLIYDPEFENVAAHPTSGVIF